jgi:hypothetical protein
MTEVENGHLEAHNFGDVGTDWRIRGTGGFGMV